MGERMRVLLTGWPSFLNGEATAGDVLSMDRVRRALVRSGVPCEVAWSQVFRPGSLGLDDADPKRYTHLVFICGPVHGEQVRWLHHRFSRCRRIAVGVTVCDPSDPAVTGFDVVLARDTPQGQGRRDLSATARTEQVPVVGVVLAPGQREYGERRRHDEVHQRITTWLLEQDCARVPVDTRLDPRQWRNPSTPGQLDSVLCRLDAVLTTRLHGLVLALRHGVPVLAVDPVDGGAKVGAQAAAWGWPALVTAGEVLEDVDCLRPWWNWCLSAEGRMLAAERATAAFRDGEQLVTDLLGILCVKIA
jgi:hypothetical protein